MTGLLRCVAALGLLLLAACATEMPAPHPAAVAPAPFPSRPLGVRSGEITASNPVPPGGYGLYLFVLPARMAPTATLTEIARYACSRLLPAGTGENRAGSALFLVPVRPGQPRGTADAVDVALSASLLRRRVEQPNPRDVYVVVTTSRTITNPAAPDDIVIRLAPMAPAYVGTWLSRLTEGVERGQVAAPADFDLRARNVFYAVGSLGDLVGIKPANAEPARACSAR